MHRPLIQLVQQTDWFGPLAFCESDPFLLSMFFFWSNYVQNVSNVAPRGLSGQIRRKIAFWPDKLAQRAPPGPSRFHLLCSNLGPPLPTQNRPSGPNCVVKRLFLAYFVHFLAPLGPHLGHSGSGK